jgi:hypothetical protein
VRPPAGAPGTPPPVGGPADPRHRPVVLHVTPRRPALLHRGDRLSSAVGSVLVLVPLLILTCTAAWAAWLVADPSSSAAGTDLPFAVPRGTAAAPGAGAQVLGIRPPTGDPAAAVLAPSDPASPGGGDPAVSPTGSSTSAVQPMSMDVTVAVVDGPPADPPVGNGTAAAAPGTAAAAPDTGAPDTGTPAGLTAASTTTGTQSAATTTETYAAVAPATTTPAEVTPASVTPAPATTTSGPEDTYQSSRHHDDDGEATETPAAPPDEDGGSATSCPVTSTPPVSVVVEVPNLPTVSIPLP